MMNSPDKADGYIRMLADAFQRCNDIHQFWDVWKVGYPKDAPPYVTEGLRLAMFAGVMAACERLTRVPEHWTEEQISELLRGLYDQSVKEIQKHQRVRDARN